MIKIRNLTKSYKVRNGRHYVFRGVDADFPEGANIAIIGPNGGGKSTFLRILGGIDHPDSGEIITPRSFSWPLGLRGGFVGHMTGRDNCRMICNLYGLHHRHTRKKLDEIKELSGIKEYFEEPVKYYSSGMAGRLGFALSMAFSFDYFLIDEITAVGDAHFREMAKRTLEEKARFSKVIMVSHSMGDIKKFCDVGVLLKDGKLTVYNDLDEAIRAYLPQTETAEADFAEILSQACLDDLSIDEEALPKETQNLLGEIQALLASIESGLASPEHTLAGETSDFYSLLGSAYQQIGDLSRAEDYHRKAVAENEYILRSQQALAALHAKKNEIEAESAAIEKAIKIDERHVQNYVLKVRLLRKSGEFDAAMQLCEENLKYHSDKPAPWNEYAQLLQSANQLSKAIEAQARAIQLAESNSNFENLLPAFHAQLGQILAANGNLEQSAKAAYKFHRLPKPDPINRYKNTIKTLRSLDRRISV
ncbi:MAG: ATP-binding cassette domain-containing protein [Verrucomicrobia bacterium]|jgi:capsular polysaccharide transport system ATP-binding protein|nr:ATP-binding cassette domain-containing protein [Verrucomicrobiota bacterium]